MSRPSGTIGAEYAARTREKSDLAVLAAIAADRCQEHAAPPRVAVHLRLGDALCDPRPAAKARRPLPTREIVDVLRRATRGGPQATIYYGVHHDRRAVVECTSASHAYAKDIAEALGAELVAGDATDADRHFCDMAYATTFVQGKGGYSQLVADLRAALGRRTVVVPELASTKYHSPPETTRNSRRPMRRKTRKTTPGAPLRLRENQESLGNAN